MTTTAPSTADPPQTPSEDGARIGAAARSGMTWMTIASLLVKVAMVLSQLVLARLLTQTDFGLYAASISLAGFVLAFRDAGVTGYLIRYGVREYGGLAAPVFWLALAVNLVCASVLVALGMILSLWSAPEGSESAYLHPEFPALLYTIALSFPLGTPGAILKVKMRLDLQFRQLSALLFASSLARYVSLVLFAFVGAGAQSFVLPILVMALVDWVWSQAATRDRAWLGRPRLALWPTILREVKWLLLGTLGGVIFNMGSYSVVAFFVAASTVGVYFFAYQLTQQICALITMNLVMVLAPVLVHINDQPERFRGAAVRTLRVLMLFAAPLTLGLGLTFGPIETIILGGKWRDAVIPVIIFGALSPLVPTQGLTYSVLTSAGRFVDWAVGSLAEGLIIVAAAGAAALLDGSPLMISAATALSMVFTRIAITAHTMKRLGVSRRTVAGACAGAWAIALATAPVAYLAAKSLSFGNPIAEFFIAGTAFVALYGAAIRIVMPRSLAEALTMVPARFRGLAMQALNIRAPGSAK